MLTLFFRSSRQFNRRDFDRSAFWTRRVLQRKR